MNSNENLKTRVDSFVQRLRREDVCMHGFILSVGGEIKATAYYAPFQEGETHRMYSVSKSMTGLAIGILLGEEKLHLSDHIVDYFPDMLPETPDPRLMRLEIQDMLRMAACYRSTAYRNEDSDWTRPFFTAKSTHEPGTVFHYDTGASQVLSELVKRVSGEDVLTFLQKRVFQPLGTQDEMYWLVDDMGARQGGTGLGMSLRDLHRVARMIMEGGHGLVPDWFCREMVRCHTVNLLSTPEEERYGYGWQVWMTRAGWAMYGLGGQLAVACPEKDALLCTIADTRLDPVGVQRIYDAFFEEIYPYLGAEDMTPCHLKLTAHALPNDSAFAMESAGPYFFEEGNMLRLRSVELQSHTLLWENDRGKHPLRFGIGENLVDVFPGWPELPTLSSGGWVGKGLLHVRCQIIGDAPCGVEMLLHFSNDCLTVQSRKSFDPATDGYEGVASGYAKVDKM